MSPKTADPAVRDALVEAAARLIAQHEPLTTRRLATEIGLSTMAVYTHFGSMEELRRAVRREGFERFARHLNAVEQTDDPVADLVALGSAYCANAVENPNLYRVMFMESAVDEADAEVGLDTFQTLVDAIQRCIDAGRFDKGSDAGWLATQGWTMVHGVTALYIAGMLDLDTLARVALTVSRSLFISFGDRAELIDRSIQATDLGTIPAAATH